MKGGFLTIILSPQPPERSPLGPEGTEPETACTEGGQRGEREPEVPAWALQPGKKLAVGWGTVCHPAQSGELFFLKYSYGHKGARLICMRPI